MAENTEQLICSVCERKYPADLEQCPEDGGALIPLPPADELIGKLFAHKYEIISLLGEGGMSRVYRARHTYMKRIIAVKVLHEKAATDDVAKARFQREAEAASSLSHPNVVTVHDFGVTEDGRAYFTMDCLDGKSLDEIIDEIRFIPIQQAIDIFSQACEGLEHAHRNGVIHRDIKPSNLVILKQEDGSDLVKIVDFGIAKIVRSKPENEKGLRVTQTGEIFGTASYMSPEQCNGASLDAQSDIYSFGCLMYEALAGVPPFIGNSYVATVAKHVMEAPKPLSSVALTNVSPQIESVIMKCLEKKQESRYATAGELRQALLDAAYASGLKGLRMGAVRERKEFGVSGSLKAHQPLQTTQRSKNIRKRNVAIILSVPTVIAAAALWVVFMYQGPAGDLGTLYDKFQWQSRIADADDLMKDGKFADAVVALEGSEKIARTFGDDNRRLEATLLKMVDAYTANREPEKLEKVNNELVLLSNNKVFSEYNMLMSMLKQWEDPNLSNVKREELALQAVAFGERISRCADKLSVRSQVKAETLLKRSAKTYDLLNLREGIFRMRLRIQLAEMYKQQERLDDQMQVLLEALQHSPENPQSESAWRLKAKIPLLLGQLHSANNELQKAKSELDNAVAISREHVGAESDLLRDSLNASSQLYRKLHTPEFDKKAFEFSEEGKKITAKLDSDEDDNKK